MKLVKHVAKKIKLSTHVLLMICGVSVMLSGCADFFLGKENIVDPIDLAKNPHEIEFQRQWRKKIGDGIDERVLSLRPLKIDNRVFVVSSDGDLVALDADSGSEIWSADVGHRIASGVSGNKNIVVIGSQDGLLMAFDNSNGESLWEYQLSTEIMATPSISGNLVIARSTDGQVTAINASNGNQLWQQDIGVANLSIRGNARAVALGKVILFTNGRGRVTLLSTDDGRVVFSTPLVRGSGITEVERIADLIATPVVRNGVLFISAYRHKTLAIHLESGNLLWESPFSTDLDLFADNRYLYIADENSLVQALDMSNGKRMWTSKALQGRRISPLSGDGRMVMTIDFEGNLTALDTRDGRLLGYQNVGDERNYIAPIRVGEETWLTYTGNGDLTKITVNFR